MNIQEIIGDAIKYPASNWRKLITLGILFLLVNSLPLLGGLLPAPLLVLIGVSLILMLIPLFFVIGYAFRVLRTTIAGFDELPEFDKIWGMFIDGLKVSSVAIVYMIIPWLIMNIGPFIAHSNPTASSITRLLGIIIAIIFGLLLTIAIAHMAANDRFKAAFRFREILDVISEIGWGKYILWYIIVAIIVWIISFILNFIITLGYIGLNIATGPLLAYIIANLLYAIFIRSYLSLFYLRALGLLYPK
ncbi:MAG: DUF4013 domain-containing protein [Methanobacteriaceae archaeon]|nr:DUF4013 domain-containing protein [Methanobacteriaceae archaeon]